MLNCEVVRNASLELKLFQRDLFLLIPSEANPPQKKEEDKKGLALPPTSSNPLQSDAGLGHGLGCSRPKKLSSGQRERSSASTPRPFWDAGAQGGLRIHSRFRALGKLTICPIVKSIFLKTQEGNKHKASGSMWCPLKIKSRPTILKKDNRGPLKINQPFLLKSACPGGGRCSVLCLITHRGFPYFVKSTHFTKQ